MRGKRNRSVRAAEEYGCPNGSRRRRVYCAARDAVGVVRGSGLVGTCYGGVMAVSEYSDRLEWTDRRGSVDRTVARPFANCRVERAIATVSRPSSVPRAHQRLRAAPGAPERTRAPSRNRAAKICRTDRSCDLAFIYLKRICSKPISRRVETTKSVLSHAQRFGFARDYSRGFIRIVVARGQLFDLSYRGDVTVHL